MSLHRRDGSILMVALWILALLVVFAVGLGHRAAINLRLARYQRDSLKAQFLANAGIQRSLVEISNASTTCNTLNESWSSGKDASGSYILQNVTLGDDAQGYFTVGSYDKDGNYTCMVDEESKVNINKLDSDVMNKTVIGIFAFSGVDNPQNMKDLLVNWTSGAVEPEDTQRIFKNSNFTVTEEIIPALEYYYQKSGEMQYHNKSKEVFGKMKGMVTVYTNGSVNINTVPIETLRIMANASVDASISAGEVDNFVSNITVLRQIGNLTDISSTGSLSASIALNSSIVDNLSPGIVYTSNFFNIPSKGNAGNITKAITVVYDRGKNKFVYWHEDWP